MPSHNLLDINWIITVLRRWLWLIIGLTVLAVVVAFVAFSMMPPEYSATVTMMVDSPRSNASQYNDLVAAERIAFTYSQMLKDRAVMDAAVAKIGKKITSQSLASKITISPISQTQLLQLTATSNKPEEASIYANTVAETFAEHVQDLSNQRYADSLKNAQDKVAGLQTEVDNTQLEINTLLAKKIDNQVKLSQLNTDLTRYQTDYRSIQQNYQNLQLTIASATGDIHLVEPAQVQTLTSNGQKSVTIIMSIGDKLSKGQNNISNDHIVLSYGQLLFSTPLLDGVIKDLGINESANLFARRIKVDLVPGTQLLRLRVDGQDAVQTKAWGEALANAFMDKVKALVVEPYSGQLSMMQQQLDDTSASINKAQDEISALTSENMHADSNLQSLNTALANSRTNQQNAQKDLDQLKLTITQTADAVTITEPAHTPKRSNNNRNLYVSLAGLIGLVFGTGLAIFIGYMDGRIRTRQDVMDTLKLPLLGSIGKIGKDELVVKTEPNSQVAENFRSLATKVRLLSAEKSLHTLLVTSAAPSEGKSVVVSNLAITLARMGVQVLAVDADLWLPRLHTLFGLPQASGLTSFLSSGTWSDKLKKPAVSQLEIVTSGDVDLNPSEHLSSPYLEKMFEELAPKADLILIDCPPVLSAADTSLLASLVDGILLVVRAGQTEGQAALEAINLLDGVKTKIIGVVLNAVQDKNENYHRYYYGKVAAKKDAPLAAKQS